MDTTGNIYYEKDAIKIYLSILKGTNLRNYSIRNEFFFMLKWSYMNFGFLGTVLLAFFLFVLFIFFVAGLAGIVDQPDDTTKNYKIILAIVFPPYPIIWLFLDMYRQGKALKS